MFSGKVGSFVLSRFFLENALWDDNSNLDYQLNFAFNSPIIGSPNITNFSISQQLSDLVKDWRGANGYTIEFIHYPTAPPEDIIPIPNAEVGVGNFRVTSFPSVSVFWAFGLTRGFGESDYKLSFNYNTSDGRKRIQTAADIISPGQWYRLALVIEPDGNDRIVSIYLDGVRQDIRLDGGAFSNTITIPQADLANVIIGDRNAPMSLGGTTTVALQNTLRGYVDELRISDTARYSGATYNISNFPFSNDANTVALLQFDGTASSTVFKDSSINNFKIANPGQNVIISDDKRNLGP